MTFAAAVSRDELELADLSLSDPGVYEARENSIGVAGVRHRRVTVQSPYVPGRALVGSVPDVVDSSLTVLVFGASHAELANRVGAVIAAFTQFTYVLTFTHDTAITSWRCEAADWTVGDQGVLDSAETRALVTPVSLVIPRSPTPLSGPY